MAEIPRLHLDSSSMEMNIGAQKISVSDHMSNEKSDSFIVDMESISNGGGKDSDVSTNSRITIDGKPLQLQRNLSRKNTHRGAGDRDSLLVSCSSSPRGPSSIAPEDASTHSQSPMAVDQQHNRHHQITTNVISSTTVPERRSNMSHRRTPWFSPKRVLLFFATLSSVGTMLLICFTLAAGKTYDNDSGKGWHA